MTDTGREPELSEGEPELSEGPDGSEDEAKRKFREVLEAKQAREAESAGGRQGRDGGKVRGAHGPAASRRSFRRRGGG
jgi:hypothetical protein